MENYKIVALDLDGTLLDSEKNIAKSTAQYLISIQKKISDYIDYWKSL
nr:HAD hydrolase family protein [Mammaliicoccus lentus]